MGANLVTQVLASWTHVSDRAFRVLVRMAVTALDNPTPKQPAAIYRAGRDLLAMSLRTEGNASTRYRAVKRAVAELTEAGAIEHLATGWAGQNAVYRLTLDRSKSSIGPDRMGGSSDPPEGGSSDPPMGGQNATEWGAPATPPRNHKDLQEEREEEEGADLRTASHPPRATAKPDSKPIPPRCPDHFIALKPRTDGKAPCPLCRAGAPPTPIDTLADVIPIDSRRPA